MSKRYKIMAVLLVVFLSLLIIGEATQPEPVNWFPGYGKQDKIPFGTYVFYDQLPSIIDEERLEDVNIPPFEFLLDSTDTPEGTYLFLNSSVYNDASESAKILDWVAKGNTLFVASKAISETILDSLCLNTEYLSETSELKKRPLANLSNPSLKASKPYRLNKDVGTVYFDQIDTTQTTILGVYDLIRNNDSTKILEPKVNFIKTPYRKGTVILNTFPEGFTNVFMLDSLNASYTAKALSYLPKEGKIYLDQHYKNSKATAVSPLYLILTNKYLKWSWYTLLMGALIWIYFEGKRKQRSIPVIKPLPNQTLDYTRTIAGMYLDKKDNRQIAMHQINHLLEHIRSTYTLATDRRDSAFIEKLATKSGIEQATVKNLIDYTITIRQKAVVTEDELIKLNSLIEKFKNSH
ncbi:putative protein DUF4350 [Leeuwenhoekiella aestuarii]|uniref:DUF4350 domain-containing protein n=1 Tax=Leeuwenhoekiella aestuarii TaxID=2249426 RepID=A0A4Q0NXN0_9FLAO|nr:DUF4350 domain-containing protein [Leeuwenhoekiella aestuarii]RXG16334.1 putative protein DUF4350 [Leeuwenhoekiella aestuarii]RXG17027.1 putative protein DUF4350 [Leeuwenhoekiella aestuarii]